MWIRIFCNCIILDLYTCGINFTIQFSRLTKMMRAKINAPRNYKAATILMQNWPTTWVLSIIFRIAKCAWQYKHIIISVIHLLKASIGWSEGKNYTWTVYRRENKPPVLKLVLMSLLGTRQLFHPESWRVPSKEPGYEVDAVQDRNYAKISNQ